MKKVLLKRVFASTLAGTLALSLPLTAAAAGGEGGTQGDGNVVGASGDFFSVVLPTNTASNVNFTIDPNNYLSGDKIQGVDGGNYDPNTRLYFTRTDYNQMAMGVNGQMASDFWGDIKNQNKVKQDDPNGPYEYGNTSNWMTITNKSAAPVTVELKVEWEKNPDVTIVNSMDALEKTKDAAIYMEIQASEGRTGGVTTNPYNKANYDYTIDKSKDSYGKENLVVKKVGEEQLIKAYKPAESDPKLLQTIDMPKDTRGNGEATYVTWVIPTISSVYDTLHKDAFYRTMDGVIEAVTDDLHEAYYLKAYYDKEQTVQGVEVWNNRNKVFASLNGYTKYVGTDGKDAWTTDPISNASVKSPFSSSKPFTSYDESINIYPTYGFRLHGEASEEGWKAGIQMPKIILSWKVTIGEPTEDKDVTPTTQKVPVVWDGVELHDGIDSHLDKQIDIVGVIDDTQYYKVLYNGAKLDSIVVDAKYPTGQTYTHTIWADGKSEQVRVDGILVPESKEPVMWNMVDIQNVTNISDLRNEGLVHDARVNINLIMLLNYSQAKFFVDQAEVKLTYNFTLENGKAYPVEVYLKDSKNNVQDSDHIDK